MSRIIRNFRRPTHRLALRLRNARPGSVLILVVALLVLMALIGTAWLSTARTDRYSSRQNSYNTQIDLLLQAVVTLAESSIINDVVASGLYRPAEGTATTDYEHYDSPARDKFMASRLPVRFGTNAGDPPVWPYISGPPTGDDLATPFSTAALTAAEFQRRGNLLPTFLDITVAGATTRFPAFEIPGTGGKRYVAADADGDGIADSSLFVIPVGNLAGVTYYGAIRIVDNNSAVNASTAWEFNNPTAPTTTVFGQFSPVNINLVSLLNDTAPLNAAAQVNGLNLYRFTASLTDNNTGAVAPINATPIGEGGARADFTFTTTYDAVDKQLARRVGFPGFNTVADRYLALPVGDSLALAYRFCLRNPLASPSVLEDSQYRLGWSVYEDLDPAAGNDNEVPRTRPYTYDQALLWLNQNFDFANIASPNVKPVRSLLVARNGVSTALPFKGRNMGVWLNTADYTFGDIVRHTLPGQPERAFWCMAHHGANYTGGVFTPGAAGSEPIWAPLSTRMHPARASANTAPFGELWMAFCNTMDARGAGAPYAAAPFPTGVVPNMFQATPRSRREFRSALRDPNQALQFPMDTSPDSSTVQLLPVEMMQIRSALAAVNAIDDRDVDNDVTARKLYINRPNIDGTVAATFEVDVFGNEPQPFITEIYVNNRQDPDPNIPAGNPRGYVAIELYNPYPTAISLKGWNIGVLDRRGPTLPTPGPGSPPLVPNFPYPTMKFRGLTTFTGFGNAPSPIPAPTIPAGGYLILENYANQADRTAYGPVVSYGPALTRAATGRWAASGLATVDELPPVPPQRAVTNRYYVPDLHEVMRRPSNTLQQGGEVYLLRPRRGDGTLTDDTRTPPATAFPYAEVNSGTLDPDARSNALGELIPVDSVDLHGLVEQDALLTAADGGPQFRSWHYVRVNGTGNNKWRCVYPGRWDPTSPWDAVAPPGGSQYHQEGIVEVLHDSSTTPEDWTGQPVIINLEAADTTATYINPFGPIPLGTPDTAGPRVAFGGFARNGDVLRVPFIGAYRVRAAAAVGTFLEMNPITQDSVFAHDADSRYGIGTQAADADNSINPIATDPSDDADEQVGRFCPIERSPRVGVAVVGDFDVNPLAHRYAWALDLFDHIGVQVPQNDYLPDVDPGRADEGLYGTTPPYPYKYPPANASVANEPEAVPNGGATTVAAANRGQEDNVGVEGLVNINTASFTVLRTVPMIDSDMTVGGLNDQLADAIIYFRDVDAGAGTPHGPFKSLHELNLVYDRTDTTTDPLLRRGFRNAWGTVDVSGAGAEPTFQQGDLSPGDGVRQDYEERNLMLSRVSNMLTTRSDTFTVYVQIQGWRGVGTASPELVAQRRAAFIADRNGINQNNRLLSTVNVPTN